MIDVKHAQKSLKSIQIFGNGLGFFDEFELVECEFCCSLLFVIVGTSIGVTIGSLSTPLLLVESVSDDTFVVTTADFRRGYERFSWIYDEKKLKVYFCFINGCFTL